VGKDVTTFWQAGGRVRDWVQLRFELARVRAVGGQSMGRAHIAAQKLSGCIKVQQDLSCDG